MSFSLTISRLLPSSERHPQRRFALVAGLLWLAWLLGYEHYLQPAGHLDALLSGNLAHAGAAVLRGLGFAAAVLPGQPRLLHIDGQPGVWIGDACNGLVLYALLAGFVVAYPGGGWRRLPFVVGGGLLLYGLNVGRVAALALNHHYYRQSVEFNHHYTFTCVVYAALLALWLSWVRFGATPATAAR